MAIDPYLIGTAILAPASAVLTVAWIGARNSARIAWEELDKLRAHSSLLSQEYLAAKAKLTKFEDAELRRHNHLKAISAKGAAASQAVLRKRREEAKAKTITEFAECTIPSRAKVVAPVKARRTRAKKAETV